MTRGLAGMLQSEDGRALLRAQGLYLDRAAFFAALQPPRLDLDPPSPRRFPVYLHQQPYFDYRASVVAKFLALRALAREQPEVGATVVWIDTDRAASDKLALRMYWPTASGRAALRWVPAGCERQEARFITLDQTRVAATLRHLAALVAQTPGCLHGGERWQRFAALIAGADSLVGAQQRLSRLLFEDALAWAPAPLLVSSLLGQGPLQAGLERLLARRSDFIRVYNQTIEGLAARDFATAVRPLPADYLPLFYSCPRDGRRLRLRHEQVGGGHWAVAAGAGGAAYRFFLGSQNLSLAELLQTGRLSPDVTLPILLNDCFSGLVVGRSSALYMLVFGQTMRRVLGMCPLPMLIPSSFETFGSAFDSLVHAWFRGQQL